MDLHKLHIEHIEKLGWTVECISPLKLRHTDGSFATNQAAQIVIDNFELPSICEKWSHPDLDLMCEYVDQVPDAVEHVWEYDDDGRTSGLKPYYDYPRVGDYWVENGHWYGRREPDGFRVLATGHLIECDDSKWEMKESFAKMIKIEYDDLAF